MPRYLRARLLILIVLPGLAIAQPSNGGTRIQLTGYLVDIACATDASQSTPGWAPKHSRKCLLMDACARSGYGVLTENNELLRFDASGNKLARRAIFGDNRDMGWRVRVRGYLSEKKLAVSKLELLPK